MTPKLFSLVAILSFGLPAFPTALRAQTPPANAKQPSAAALNADEPDARGAAERWLPTIDSGKAAEAWRALSSSTSDRVDEAKWSEAMAGARKEFGEPKGRRFHKMALHQTAESKQDLDFYLIEYDSTSIEQGALREFVRVVKDLDGSWRVAGYTIGLQPRGGDDEEGGKDE